MRLFIIIFALFIHAVNANNISLQNKPSFRCYSPYGCVDEPSERGFIFIMRVCKYCNKEKPLSDFKKCPPPKEKYYLHKCYDCHNRLARRYTITYALKRNTPIENLPNEIWKDVAGFEGLYQISNMGRLKRMATMSHGVGFGVKSDRFLTEKIKLQSNDKNGYLITSLTKGKRQTQFRVHVLVAKAFIPNPENKPTVNHKLGIKTDNRATELEWMTHKEQIIHAQLLGLRKSKQAA